MDSGDLEMLLGSEVADNHGIVIGNTGHAISIGGEVDRLNEVGMMAVLK